MNEIIEFARKKIYREPAITEIPLKVYRMDEGTGGMPPQEPYDDPFSNLYMPNLFK